MDFIKNHVTLLGGLGCGLAVAVAGVYGYSRLKTIEELRDEVVSLRKALDLLKRDFQELKVATENGSIQRNLIEDRFASLTETDRANSDVDSTRNFSHIALAGSEATLSTIDDNEDEFFDFAESENSDTLVNVVNGGSVKANHALQNGCVNHEDDFSKWLPDLDALMSDSTTNKQQLYERVMDGKEKYGPRPEILWRLARATHLLAIAAENEGDLARKKELTFLCMEHARAALGVDEQNFECHKWYAIAIGSLGDYVSTKERIEGGYTFKKHVDMALALKPDDATLHHMLGRWAYEVSKLSWVEKKVASTLFAKVPEASNEEALQSLLKAYELKPLWKENILFIVHCYVALQNYSEANKWIDRGLALEVGGEDDKLAHEKLQSLYKKHASR